MFKIQFTEKKVIEECIYNDKTKCEIKPLTPNQRKRTSVKEGSRSYTLSFNCDVKIDNLRDNQNRPLTQLLFTTIWRGYFGWTQKLKQGWDFNTFLKDGKPQIWWDQNNADSNASVSQSQYFTFKIIRTSVSKFDVKWTGNIAGLWVALPGSTIDSTSSANGWIDMSIAYAGAGIPGVNSPGNGSDGCALGGIAPLNSAQTNKSVTATFGTVSSSSTATNEIYIRVKLTSGQSVTALSLQTASN